MADVTKCLGIKAFGTKGNVVCPHKDSCYRYTAEANEYWQSYFAVIPLDIETNLCHYYWNNKRNTD